MPLISFEQRVPIKHNSSILFNYLHMYNQSVALELLAAFLKIL